MPYIRRNTFPHHPNRDDYVIRCEGLDVGRVYLAELPEGERYCWFVYINGHVSQVPGVPVSGRAVTLDEAGAQFKRSYEEMRAKAGLPRPQG
jgi:hypothetical protein